MNDQRTLKRTTAPAHQAEAEGKARGITPYAHYERTRHLVRPVPTASHFPGRLDYSAEYPGGSAGFCGATALAACRGSGRRRRRGSEVTFRAASPSTQNRPSPEGSGTVCIEDRAMALPKGKMTVASYLG